MIDEGECPLCHTPDLRPAWEAQVWVGNDYPKSETIHAASMAGAAAAILAKHPDAVEVNIWRTDQ